MKLRKHKNNKTFLITFSSRSHVRAETHVDENGKARKVVPEIVTSSLDRVWATGSCKQSVMRAFLFGRDAGNMSAIIRECRPLDCPALPVSVLCPALWLGKLVNS